MASEHVTDVTTDSWQSEVLDAETPVLVDFWATWCPPCVALSPVVEQVGAELAGKAKVVKVNVDEQRDLAVQHGIRSIPVLMVYKGGEEKERLNERRTDEIVSKLEAHM